MPQEYGVHEYVSDRMFILEFDAWPEIADPYKVVGRRARLVREVESWNKKNVLLKMLDVIESWNEHKIPDGIEHPANLPPIAPEIIPIICGLRQDLESGIESCTGNVQDLLDYALDGARASILRSLFYIANANSFGEANLGYHDLNWRASYYNCLTGYAAAVRGTYAKMTRYFGHRITEAVINTAILEVSGEKAA